MTMVNSTVSAAPSSRGGVSLRKTNKPLMEKRRRARINDSLSQLKSLVIHSSKKDSSQFSKLEKADILELTVKHLRGLQAQQQQPQHRPQHPMGVQPLPSGPPDTLVNGKYRAGFVECANEVIRYLDQAQGLNQETRSKVVSHLANCLQLVSTSQSKIPPQPISQQATTAPPANAAAILAAAAAAATNGNIPAAQAHYGQIIQIVSNPLQTLPNASGPTVHGLNPKPSTPASNANIQGIRLSSHSEQAVNQPKNSTVPTASKPINHNPAANAQSPYIHYAQPLHIQIPPIVSPVLVQKGQTVKQVIESKESTNTFSSSSSNSSNQSSSPEQIHDVVSSTSVTSSPRTTTSPPSLYPGHPKARAQKQLNFYMQEDLKCDNYYRSGKHSLTPSSSSSTSSSDCENTSPLNLSQSPPFSAFKSNQRRSMFGSVSQKLNYDHKQSVCPYPSKSSSRLENQFALASNTTSVIVNSRKCSDFSEGKCWSMMEDDRLYSRQRNTPSPASSVGEERVWRPW